MQNRTEKAERLHNATIEMRDAFYDLGIEDPELRRYFNMLLKAVELLEVMSERKRLVNISQCRPRRFSTIRTRRRL